MATRDDKLTESEESPPCQVRGASPRRGSLSRRLLVGINLALAVILGLFLIVDYRAASKTLLEQRRAALNDEAKILLRAMMRLCSQGTQALQSFVDEACGDMQEAASPGHHIAVRLGAVSIQAQTHHRASPGVLAAMQAGAGRPDGRASLGDETIVVGTATHGEVVVYVSEYLSDIHRVVRDVLVWRITTIIVVGIALGIVFNVLLRRLLMRPLRGMVETVRQFSQGHLDARMPQADTVELGFLADEFDLMASALERTNAEHRAQMTKARRIQDNLRPDLSKMRGVRLSCLFQPATEVAGDYYDAVPLSDGALLFCMADVTGHGVPAAIGAAMLKSLLQVATERERQPEGLLRLLNAAFYRVSLDEDFATMTLVRWDPPRSMLTLANAGHGMVYLLRKAGGTETFDSTGPALGLVAQGEWTSERTFVAAGDRLVIVTDGVIETATPDGDLFGSDRLLAFLEQSRKEPVDALSSRLADTLASFRGPGAQSDDITMLAVEF